MDVTKGINGYVSCQKSVWKSGCRWERRGDPHLPHNGHRRNLFDLPAQITDPLDERKFCNLVFIWHGYICRVAFSPASHKCSWPAMCNLCVLWAK